MISFVGSDRGLDNTDCVLLSEWLTELCRFDPASLAILDRFDRLESLLFSSGTLPQEDERAAIESRPSNPSSPKKDAESDLDCVQSSLINVRLEAVLKWQPLQHCLGSITFATPNPSVSSSHTVLLSALSDEFDMGTCNRLLEKFWSCVHAKNPILDKDEIRRFMHQVCFNGVGWDEQSCLVVSHFSENIPEHH